MNDNNNVWRCDFLTGAWSCATQFARGWYFNANGLAVQSATSIYGGASSDEVDHWTLTSGVWTKSGVLVGTPSVSANIFAPLANAHTNGPRSMAIAPGAGPLELMLSDGNGSDIVMILRP